MTEERLPSKFAFILHADIAGSTQLVQRDEELAHKRIQSTFRRFDETITKYHGQVRELRGDALLAEFERASDAVAAALVFQTEQSAYLTQRSDDILPTVRVGVAMGEVIIADDTVTGAGVVLAQRVEQLAEPGAVCVTGAIQEALPQRMPFVHQSMGENSVKGFTEPVRVYTVKVIEGQTIPPPNTTMETKRPRDSQVRGLAAAVLVLFALGGLLFFLQPWRHLDIGRTVSSTILSDALAKPSIAVLPFENMGADPEQSYFADGITDDLITDLTKIPGLFVIARDSVFYYKDRTLDPREVGEKLNAQYVLHGSVRQDGDRLRINTQLVDARTGGQIWADRYDGQRGDIFTLQDNITGQIVDALSINLDTGDHDRLALRDTSDLKAYDYYLRGRDRFFLFSRDGTTEAQGLLRKALEIDGGFASAHALMGWTYVSQAMNGWHDREEALSLSKEHADKSIELNDQIPLSYFVTGLVYRERDDWSSALIELEKATEIDPNYANAHVLASSLLYYDGRPKEGLERMKVAIRLNPHNPSNYAFHLGQAYYILREYPEAIDAFVEGLELLPTSERLHVWLAAAYAQAGEMEDAAWEVDEVMLLNPDFSLGKMSESFPFKNSDDEQHFLDGLVKAGFPG